MELVLAVVAAWLILATCLGILLGRSAHDADAAELGSLPSTGKDPVADLSAGTRERTGVGSVPGDAQGAADRAHHLV